MTEQERLEILEYINALKRVFNTHSTHNIIEDEQERMKHLDTILDQIRELEQLLQNDLDSLN
jgi:2-iminoacetate synthase ThiH